MSKDINTGKKCINTDTIPITIYRKFYLYKTYKNYNHWLVRKSYTKNSESIGETLYHHNICNKIVINK